MLIEGCVLKIERGVAWVHIPDGSTVLRICGLPVEEPPAGRLLDITLKNQTLANYTFNWGNK
jgi:hypothetical protein